jgi:hypothetical protein
MVFYGAMTKSLSTDRVDIEPLPQARFTLSMRLVNAKLVEE